MNCVEFRLAAGADPDHLSAEVLAHREGCPQCAQFLREIQHLDATIFKALQVSVSPPRPVAALPTPRTAMAQALGDRRRWFALAASIAGGVAIGALLWASGSRNVLARDVLQHIAHEPEALVAGQAPADPDQVRRLLEQDGVRLTGDLGKVTYLRSCPFRGHEVPHLVVQTAAGPVTVLLLRNEHVKSAVDFRDRTFSGTIEPAGEGSIAVVGGSPAQVREATGRILKVVQWLAK